MKKTLKKDDYVFQHMRVWQVQGFEDIDGARHAKLVVTREERLEPEDTIKLNSEGIWKLIGGE